MNREVTGISEALRRLLIARGYTTAESINKFLYPKFEDLRSPFEFKEMDIAVNRIIKAIERNEKIVIVGHDDVDGITATTVVYSVIKNLGGNISFYIPKNKIDEIKIDANLIITVDCGTSTRKICTSADIIITDHHEIINDKPNCYSFINPKLDYPFPYLAGVGVAYKLAQGLAMSKLKISPKQWFSATKNLLSLVAMGTIADKVPIVDENRVFVKLYNNGDISQIYNTIQIIGSVKGICPDIGVKFLLEPNNNLYSELNKLREERISKIEETYKKCLFGIEKINNIIFIYDDSLDENLIGVCASKLMNKNNLPTIIITRKDNVLIGEARSPYGFDLIQFFNEVKELFINWGGHKQACGFCMNEKNLAELKKYISRIKFYIPLVRSSFISRIDVEIYPSEINDKFINEIKLLEPYGEGNHPPIFITKGVNKKDLDVFSSLPDGSFDVIWRVKQNKPEIIEWK